MNITLIGLDNYKGLGVLTREWVRHLPVTKVLVRNDDKGYLQGAKVASNPKRHLNWLLRDTDILVSLETPYPQVFQRAQQRGITTALKVNYEFLPQRLKHEPDIYLCSTEKNYQAVSSGNKKLIPDPVNCNKIDFHQRKQAKTLLHNAGTVGINGPNGTKELMEAMQYVESDIELVVRSQKQLECNDSRVKVENKKYENYWEMYGEEYDVFVSPQKFRATSLPIQEALAAGMPVISTDITPFAKQATWTVETDLKETTSHRFHRPIDIHRPEPKNIAEKIDEIANTNIEKESRAARGYAETISWEEQAENYKEIFSNML